MEKLDIILWILGAGFTITYGLMIIMWNSLNNRMDYLTNRVDKMDDKVTDIDRRLCRMEGAFSQKECCMLKHDGEMKKAG